MTSVEVYLIVCVKTGYGITYGKYKYSKESPIIGPGQGSQGAMVACGTASTPQLRAMDIPAHGLTFCCPKEEDKYNEKVIIYVDDNSNYSNKFKQWLNKKQDTIEVTKKIENDTKVWERCLWTSGGLLKLEKFLYYLMILEFDNFGGKV